MDFADGFLVWLVTIFLCWLFGWKEYHFLKGRIQAQNAEIVRLSKIIDGYRALAAERVAEQQRQNQPDWPKFI